MPSPNADFDDISTTTGRQGARPAKKKPVVTKKQQALAKRLSAGTAYKGGKR